MVVILLGMTYSNEREHELNQAMSAAIRARRAVRQVTMANLAETVGIPVRSMTRYLSGQGSLNYGTLVLIAEALGTTVESLAQDALSLTQDGHMPQQQAK